MIHHPIILGCKLALLLIVLIVLVLLHGILPPDQFRIAALIAGGAFLIGVIALWVFAVTVLSNPNSRLAKQMILPIQAPADEGYVSSKDEFCDMIGHRGRTLSPLRPSGIAQFGDKRISVTTEGEFIAKDMQVEIVSAAGSRVVVRTASLSESRT